MAYTCETDPELWQCYSISSLHQEKKKMCILNWLITFPSVNTLSPSVLSSMLSTRFECAYHLVQLRISIFPNFMPNKIHFICWGRQIWWIHSDKIKMKTFMQQVENKVMMFYDSSYSSKSSQMVEWKGKLKRDTTKKFDAKLQQIFPLGSFYTVMLHNFISEFNVINKTDHPLTWGVLIAGTSLENSNWQELFYCVTATTSMSSSVSVSVAEINEADWIFPSYSSRIRITPLNTISEKSHLQGNTKGSEKIINHDTGLYWMRNNEHFDECRAHRFQ